MKRPVIALAALVVLAVPVVAVELSANAATSHHRHARHHHGTRVPTDNKTITGWGVDGRP